VRVVKVGVHGSWRCTEVWSTGCHCRENYCGVNCGLSLGAFLFLVTVAFSE